MPLLKRTVGISISQSPSSGYAHHNTFKRAQLRAELDGMVAHIYGLENSMVVLSSVMKATK